MTCRNAKILMLTAGAVFIGSCGMARAEADYRDVVRDSEGEIVHLENGTCVRTKWLTDRDLCAPQVVVAERQEKRAEQPVVRPVAEFSQEERTVYFSFDRFFLSSDARQRLDTLVSSLKSDRSVKSARIVGYADRIGSVSYNERLSQKRAETVRDYLIENDYTNASVTETRWVGKSQPSTNCAAGQGRTKLIACLQNDRRVEVEIEYIHEEPTPDTR